MLTPSIVRPAGYFYALGNTPAVNLARNVPPGTDADILLLGCGDVRNILYTAYANQDSLPSKFDITCCDVDDYILTRNIIFLSFLVDELKPKDHGKLRDVYYHLYLSGSSLEFLRAQIQNLVAEAKSWNSWQESRYGSVIKFCDRATFEAFCSVIKFMSQLLVQSEPPAAYKNSLDESKAEKEARHGVNGKVHTSVRSAAPLAIQPGADTLEDLKISFAHFWEHGTTTKQDPDSGPTEHANPMFSGPLGHGDRVLHYATDPLLGFHLATAYAHLAEGSPLSGSSKSVQGISRAADAAFVQFRAWVRALVSLIRRESLVIRLVNADALALCHTFQRCNASSRSELTANIFRSQLCTNKLELDRDWYGPKVAEASAAPILFDAIDSSNLSDHLGVLNIVMSSGPLLKSRPWSALSTESLASVTAEGKSYFEELLCGETLAVGAALGLTVSEYWTNTTVTSDVQEALGTVLSAEKNVKMFPYRMTWVLDSQFACRGDLPPLPVKMDVQGAVAIIWHAYLSMFQQENAQELLRGSIEQRKRKLQSAAMPCYHRGTFVAFVKALAARVQTDWAKVCKEILERVYKDTSIMMGNNYSQEVAAQMHIQGLHTEPWLRSEIRPSKFQNGPSFAGWKTIPEVIAVSLVIPVEKLKKLFVGLPMQRSALPLQATIKSSQGQWTNYFGDLQLGFGKVEIHGAPDDDDFAIAVSAPEGEGGWNGNLPVVASFYCPTAALQVEPQTAQISLDVQPTLQAIQTFAGKPGSPMQIFQTVTGNASAVFFTRYLPNQDAHPIYSGSLATGSPNAECDTSVSLRLDVNGNTGKAASLTGRVNITDDDGMRLLSEKVPIYLRQTTPFIIEVVFGDDDKVYHLQFTLPVDKEGSKTRIARKSSYVEVVAPVSNPIASSQLQDFITPMTLTSDLSVPTIVSGALPYVNLDTLPVLDISDKGALRWLVTLASHTFSSRERRIRERIMSDTKTVPAVEALRTNFKESLFTMFMLSSGLQGDQTGLFAIERAGSDGPGSGSVQMLVAVSALRLDAASAGVVADAAVLPLTRTIVAGDVDLRAFLAMLPSFQVCYVSADDAELALWRKVLPALAERCRTWSHGEDCEYKAPDATIPLPGEHGQHGGGSAVVCSCGRGKLPEAFVALPEWDSTAAQYATRIAISPLFAVPFVEEVVDKAVVEALKRKAEDLDMADIVDKCRTCGRPEGPQQKLNRCKACLEVKYCSVDCQRADWKTRHKRECQTAQS
ncbi:hypothetical protein MCOR07_008714 [Pyricularia oryzae]|uniref:MYND-type domain-containing protein n=1 Tax=Pyricularia grisea TaxID=148305 RepID=A0ABQ8N4A0_PYRGI|nr:hypothetical protein MCOR01_002894 [Pyricularia oryzae]KAI6290986.1 hypothetical protein MCOR33_010903 [Pyricularia grisea]KAI6259083.1 hypothetical protein MCOR19_004558 [Pyricularia oryzae]KAI6306422.1 hypothetical protein MCOR29_010130 [Pyricularia oryzae]KAI6345673.1 hypothetical protein MCOR30_000846 [Pyricularia oryzae]